MTETIALLLAVIGAVLLTLFGLEQYRLKHPHHKPR